MTRLTTIFAFLALAFFAARGVAAPPTSLDGKSFQGSLREQGKKQGINDTFEFANGQFHSTACDKYGFGRADYSIEPDGRFHATTVSASDGTIEWRGTVNGDQLQGDALWLKPGKAPVRYQIQGTLK